MKNYLDYQYFQPSKHLLYDQCTKFHMHHFLWSSNFFHWQDHLVKCSFQQDQIGNSRDHRTIEFQYQKFPHNMLVNRLHQIFESLSQVSRLPETLEVSLISLDGWLFKKTDSKVWEPKSSASQNVVNAKTWIKITLSRIFIIFR